MRRFLTSARLASFLVTTVVGSALAAAPGCGGATETELFGDEPSGDGGGSSSGATSSGASGSGSSSSSGASGGSSSSGGSSGSSGASSSGSSGSSGGTDGGNEAGSSGGPVDAGPGPCTVAAPNACPQGQRCVAQGCATTGTCERVPAATDVYQPVCGCNGVSYWNAYLAAESNAQVRSSDVCTQASPGYKTCDGAGNGCPADVPCGRFRGNNGASCAALATGGLCIVTPDDCPRPAANERLYRSCSLAQRECRSLCQVIDSGDPFYREADCP